MVDGPFEHLEEGYRDLLAQIPAVTYVASVGSPTLALYVSPQIESVLGYSQQDWMQARNLWTESLHPDDRDRVLEESRRADETGKPFACEYRMIRRDGEVIWVRDHATMIRDREGTPLYFRGVMLDITEDKRKEQAVRESEAKYRALIEAVPAIVYVDSHDALPASLYVSPQVETVLGFPPEEFLADQAMWVRLIHAEDRDRVLAQWAHAAVAGGPFSCEYRMTAADGRVAWFRDEAVLVRDETGAPLFWQGLMSDITQHRLDQEALRESEARYRALVEGIPAIVYITAPDDDSKTLYVSPQVERILGYTREEWLDQPDIWMELLHPDDREPTLAAHDLHNDTGEPWSAEYRLIADDGRVVWFRDEATLVRDPRGSALFWHGVRLEITRQKQAEEGLQRANDDLDRRVRERTEELADANELLMLEIGERRRVEAELRRAEERFRLLVERLPAITYVWQVVDGLGRLEYVSPRIEDVAGFTAEEWISSPDFWEARLHPDDRHPVMAAVMRSGTTGEPFRKEYRILAKDGHIVWVLDEAVLTAWDEHGRPAAFQGVMVDIDDRKRAEEGARTAEERYRTLAERIPAVTYTWHVSEAIAVPGEEQHVSPQIEPVLGFTPDEYRRAGDFRLSRIHPDDRDRVIAATEHSEATGEPFNLEYRLLAKDGRVVWVRDEATLLERDARGHPRLFEGVFIDVTQGKEAEDRLRQAEERYRTLVEQIPAITYVEEVDHLGAGGSRFVYVSPQSEPILGFTPEELIAELHHFLRLLHPDDRERVLAEAREARRTGRPFNSIFRVYSKDGRPVWIHSKAVPTGDEHGRPRLWQGVALDITAQKESLQAVEQRPGAMAGESLQMGGGAED